MTMTISIVMLLMMVITMMAAVVLEVFGLKDQTAHGFVLRCMYICI